MVDGEECVLGVDFGGTGIKSAAVDKRGGLLLRDEVDTPADDAEALERTFRDTIRDRMEDLKEEGLEVKAVGIAAAGYVLREDGIMLQGANIAWKEAPLRRIARDITGLPATLDNDANAAAVGEWFAGVAKDVDNFIHLTLGTGIGAGIFINGKPYRGFRGTAAELGHIPVAMSGPACGFGCRGCLETLASGTALRAEAMRLFEREPEGSVLYEKCEGDPEKITGRMVAVSADMGDSIALDAFRTVGVYLGLGIVGLIHIFNPEIIVIGGGMEGSAHLFLHVTKQTVYERGIPELVKGTKIVLTRLGNDAGIIGAGAMAWEASGELSL